jgi:hypothetical protein
MTNYIIGTIFGIAILLLLGYIIDRIKDRQIKKDLGEDYEYVIMPKSKMNIKRNVTMYFNDSNVTVHKDEDKNIVAFSSCDQKNIENADFYYSLILNKQIITIIYNDGEEHIYYAIITQIELIDEDTLDIYYTVI